jgi:hypothetical protein
MKKLCIVLCAAATFAATLVNAETITLDLYGASIASALGTNDQIVSASTATWSYDSSTDILSGAGLYQERTQISAFTQLFTRAVTDLAVGGAAAASATSYACIEGNFGGFVGLSICGGYNFGTNYIDESTVSWGPGTAFSRSISGDDFEIGPQQNVNFNYDGMVGAWDDTVLVMSNVIPSTSGSRLTLARPGALVEVFDYTGLLEADATAAIITDYLRVGDMVSVPSEFIPAGRVVGQDPITCVACVPPLSTVDLMISSGPELLSLVLIDAKIEGVRGLGTGILIGSSAIWEFNTVSKIVTGSGLYYAQYQISPLQPGQLFTHSISNLIVGGGGAASAAAYECVEGSFGTIVGGNLCGNYSFGGNFIDDSSISYGPGTAFSRTIAGDDIIVGPQQSLRNYDGLRTFFTGPKVVLSQPVIPGIGRYEMTFDVIPPPIRVTLDIMPGDVDVNPVNPTAQALIPVAILTEIYFDAMQVDPATLAFGRGGAPLVHASGHTEDVDLDGDVDLVVHFQTQAADIVCGDTDAGLTGETYAGDALVGSDSIITIGGRCH